MTYEEAIKQLNSVTIYHNGKCTRTAINIAIEALDRQIPKKPLHMHKNYYCPICKEDGGCCGMMLSQTIWTNIVASADKQ